MTYHRLLTSNMTGVTSGAGSFKLLTLPEHLSSPLVYSGIHVAQCFLYCVLSTLLFFWPLYYLSILVRIMASIYLFVVFDIFKLFLAIYLFIY